MKPSTAKFIALTPKTARGVLFLVTMRMATIDQFARASNISPKHAGDFLHFHKGHKRFDLCGGKSFDGHGSAPKVYYLTKKGWNFFRDEEGLDIGKFINARPKKKWSQTMPHRLQTVSNYQDLAFHLEDQNRGWIDSVMFDFRTANYLGMHRKETTDFISVEHSENSKIVPDGALFILRSKNEGGLFFLETDMGTEIYTSQSASNEPILKKFKQYEAYFDSKHFQHKYVDWGDFSAFYLLIITTTMKRAQEIAELKDKQPHVSNQFMLVSTHEAVAKNPFEAVWFQVGHSENPPQPLY